MGIRKCWHYVSNAEFVRCRKDGRHVLQSRVVRDKERRTADLRLNRFGSDMSGRASSGRYFQMSARTSPLIHNTTTSIAALKTPGSLARSREKSFP